MNFPDSIESLRTYYSLALKHPSTDGSGAFGKNCWSAKARSTVLALSAPEDEQTLHYAGGVLGVTRAEYPIFRLPGIYYYEVKVKVIQKRLDELPPEIREFANAMDIGIGFVYTPEWNSQVFSGYSGTMISRPGYMEHVYGSPFGSGDTIGCGIDLVSNCLFYTKNGVFLGMASAESVTAESVYPAIIVSGVMAVDLNTNFGGRPFTSITNDILRVIAFERKTLQTNPLRLPSAWCRYSPHPAVTITDNGMQVESTGEVQLSPAQRSYNPAGTVVQANFPLPARIDTFYFEVEIVRANHDSHIVIGFTPGNASLSHRLGCGTVGAEMNSCGWCNNGQLFQRGKVFAYDERGYHMGDIVGCGIDLQTNQAYYTRNGISLGPALQQVGQDTTARLYPAISFGAAAGGSATLRINCGQQPFRYALQAHLRQASELTAAAAQIANIIPEETINRILDFVCCVPLMNVVSRGKHICTIGMCRLTCRYWNGRCRPFLFDTLGMNGPDRLRIFLPFLSPTLGDLHPTHLLLTDELPSWTSTGLLTLYSKLPYLRGLHLKCREEIDIHKVRETCPPLLAGRLPALLSGFTSIRMFFLSNLDFATFYDIVHIISRLPHLETLLVEHLVWKRPGLPVLQTHRQLASRLKEVHVHSCTNNNMFFSLLRITCRALSGTVHRLNAPSESEPPDQDMGTSVPSLDLVDGDAEVAITVAQLLVSQSAPACMMRIFDHIDPSFGVIMDHGLLVSRGYNPPEPFEPQAVVIFEMGAPNITLTSKDGHGHGSDFHITGVDIRIVEDAPDDILARDWDTVDTQLSACTQLKKVKVAVGLLKRHPSSAAAASIVTTVPATQALLAVDPGFDAMRREIEVRMVRTRTAGKLEITSERGFSYGKGYVVDIEKLLAVWKTLPIQNALKIESRKAL